jgi:Cu/Ag efflux protein CusF
MRKTLFPLAAAALIATSLGAFASDTTTTGVIKAVDLKAMTLTLEDGVVYTLPADFKDPGLKAGEKVTIAWKMANTKHAADTVTIVK